MPEVLKTTKITAKNRLRSLIPTYGEKHNIPDNDVRMKMELDLGFSQVQLGRWINNNRQPDLDEAFQLANFFSKNLDEIFYSVNE